MRCEKIPLQRKSMITMTMMTSMVSVSMQPLYIAFKLATVVEALVLGSVTIAGLKNKLLGSIRLLSLRYNNLERKANGLGVVVYMLR